MRKTVFRCGAIGYSLHKPHVQESFKFFDAAAPTGRVLRSEAIFAAPERTALVPWIEMKQRKKRRAAGIFGSANPAFDQDVLVRHIEINIDDSLFVYDADLFGEIYLAAMANQFDSSVVDASPYWESGIPLVEWENSQFANTVEAEHWEVLISPRHLQTVKIESNA